MDFEFRSTVIYQKTLSFQKQIQEIIQDKKPNRVFQDQLTRASTSIVLNIAEGYGRFQNRSPSH